MSFKSARWLLFGVMAMVAAATVGQSPARVELEHWAHERIETAVATGHGSAAVVQVVDGSGSRLSAGFGAAQLDPGVPLDAGRHSFRISSITKLFTAVALAQLLERGLIGSLDDPVNRYMSGWQLPDNQGRPITLHHLVTHSAGFDYRHSGLWNPQPTERLTPLQQAAEAFPGYVRMPGQWSVYSNYGGALAALVIEQVTGVPFADYLQDQVFEPLQMQHTHIDQTHVRGPVQSYYKGSDDIVLQQRTLPFTGLMQLSMGAYSSGEDMGHFMRMLLNEGRFEGRRILEPQSVALILRQRFSNHPAANGFGVFMDVVQQGPGLVLYMHNGAVTGYSAHLLLAPEHDLGLFVAVAGGGLAHTESVPVLGEVLSAPRLVAEFVNQYVAPYEHQPWAVPRGSPGQYAGVYVSAKRPLRSAEAVFEVLLPPMEVHVAPEQGQYVSNGVPASEVAAGVFMAPGNFAYREMFATAAAGPLLVIYGSTVLDRVYAWWTPSVKRLLLMCAVAVLLLGSWPVFSRLWSLPVSLKWALLLQWPLLMVFPLVLAAVGGSHALLWHVQAGSVWPLYLARGVAVAVTVLAATYCGWTIVVCRSDSSAPLAVRLQLLLLTVAAALMVAVAASLNLYGDLP